MVCIVEPSNRATPTLTIFFQFSKKLFCCFDGIFILLLVRIRRILVKHKHHLYLLFLSLFLFSVVNSFGDLIYFNLLMHTYGTSNTALKLKRKKENIARACFCLYSAYKHECGRREKIIQNAFF